MPRAVRADDLAKQNGATVAELRHETPELVPGVGECDRVRAIGNAIAGQNRNSLGAGEIVGIEPQGLGRGCIHPHQPRCGHGRRIQACV